MFSKLENKIFKTSSKKLIIYILIAIISYIINNNLKYFAKIVSNFSKFTKNTQKSHLSNAYAPPFL